MSVGSARSLITSLSFVSNSSILPFDEIREVLRDYPDAELVWCQEEPRNRGGFSYAFEQFIEITGKIALRFVGRPPMAAAAGGSIDRHEKEQAEIVAKALEGAV
jgi:2-oxoglutarate dehydrogenase E1 component